MPDWQRFRSISDSVGATLLADISHIAGLVCSGAIPSPVGYAHVITFTTHKTLTGPRGAVILTTDAALARKLDRGVFPGEQGGPHVNIFAALATTFKLAKTAEFKQMQRQITKNCLALNNRLAERGCRMVYGGTDTHLTNLDCKTFTGPDGACLSGDMAARVLDIAGIVLNRNTIPGDKTSTQASGIRMGTAWITQRGLNETDMVEVANIIADVLQACTPYSVITRQGQALRVKVDFMVLETAKLRVRALTEKAGIDYTPTRHDYPHFSYIDDQTPGKQGCLQLSSARARSFARYVFSSDVEGLAPGRARIPAYSLRKASSKEYSPV